MSSPLGKFWEDTKAVVKNTVIATCTFENDTQYPVEIVDHDGTRTLNPTESEGNYLVRGFSVDLIMKLPEGKEAKINFPSSRFENRRHKMSVIFKDHTNERPLEVLETISSWKFLYNHPGGCEMKVEMTSKHSWKKKQDIAIGAEGEAKIGAMIKAIELSSSFKLNTKLTQVDECEQQITESSVRTFKNPCYLWQETVVIKTNQPPPYHVLEIPTPHTEMTTTPSEPGRDKAIYAR
ncbi:uncharacterized protein LOC114520737 [Dendronephthya gigantea]|uniref:uncharacterized protein LOC114520737 n=1 Tax=Dendronephthya gigantea TaxID=151771 RepID=UPI0010699073|nr:uncharacterized protein LOC114520737 [Dendronephthya gigantea]